MDDLSHSLACRHDCCWGQDLRCGIGYPDFIETVKGEIYLSETDKKDSRVHLLPNEMLELMWRQSSISERATKGLALALPNGGAVLPRSVPAPKFGNLSSGAGAALTLSSDNASLCGD